MLAYFASDIDVMCETLAESICVSTPVGESLMVNRVYRGCVLTFMGRDIVANLILLDMVDFDVTLGMDWLSPYHAILDSMRRLRPYLAPTCLSWCGPENLALILRALFLICMPIG